MNQPNHRAGFSLLELSVVLGIISLVLVAGISMGGDALKAADRISTRDKLATIKMALDTYAKANGHLPCPSDRSIASSSNASFGRGAPGGICGSNAPGLVQLGNETNGAYIGGVPVRSLGLPDTYAGDAWGNKITYAVSRPMVTTPMVSGNPLTITPMKAYATQSPTLTVMYGDRTGTNYAVSSKTDYTSGAPGTITSGAGASYVAISHGPDGRGAFPLHGSAVPTLSQCQGSNAPAPCNSVANSSCNDIENCDDNNLVFYDTAYNDGSNPAQYFDDYVVWGSNALAHAPIQPTRYLGTCGSGSCDPWCAPCNYNYPDSTAAPSAGAPASLSNPVLCQKIITSTVPCEAACFWAGTNTNLAQVNCP